MQHGVADYIEITAFRNYDEGLDIYVRRSDWVDDGRYAHYQTAGTTDPRLWAEHRFDYVGQSSCPMAQIEAGGRAIDLFAEQRNS